MALPLLATKLFAPRLRPGLVLRQRLIVQLDAVGQRPLTLVSAPAGYGKTTLISSWLQGANIPSAWLSLDETDNDPLHFLQYFIVALEQAVPGIRPDLLSMLQGLQPIPLTSWMNLLINEIVEHAAPFTLVLDDFHLIDNQPILEILTFLLEHTPPPMHLVLLTRADPALPLARLRAGGQILDIRAHQLRFTLEEVSTFLNEVMGLSLSAEDIAAMEARTEGWIAGLQLAALSMQGSQDVPGFIAAFAGTHRYIVDYLVEEVLNAQPERTRLFLLQTSILGRMCASLCNRLVEPEDGESADAQALLEALEQRNLFVIPLDDERKWYRYHHLFADLLNRQLEQLFPEQVPELHRRASGWYEQNGFIPEAIQHALAAADRDRAIQLIEQNGCLLLIRGEIGTLPNWIKAVEPYAEARPWMHIFRAWILALSGQPERVEETLQIAEKLISASEPPADVRTMQGTIAAARAYLANLQGETSLAAGFARQALEYLPDIDLVSRSLRVVATALLGDASSMNGQLEEARQAYTEAKQFGQAAGDAHLVIVANSNLASVLIEQGLIHQAAQIYAETLEIATHPDGQESVIAGRVHGELAQVYYEWNRLEPAAEHVRRCIALCRQWGNLDQQAIGLVMLARLEHAQGHRNGALEAMYNAEKLASEHHLLPRYAAWVDSALARLWIAQGHLEKVSRWIRERGITATDKIPYLLEPEYQVLARLLATQGDGDTAMAVCQRLLQQAEAAKRTGRVIEVLILQVLIFKDRKQLEQALAVLKRALSLARPEGYVRTFVDEGEPMMKLLQLAKSRQIEPTYAAALCAAFDEASGTEEGMPQELIEPLSRRELEVLKLIEAGCSNQEIADKLVISLATVKRHISTIYIKLGVQSRTQAISMGRELRLFG